jgi:hypothetical protein
MRRHVPGEVAVAQGQRLPQNLRHGRDKGRAWMISREEPSPAQQVPQTRLMHRLGEATIRCPPVADDDAGKVLTEQRGRFRIAAAGEDRVHGRRGCGGGPQPVQVASDLPARFIRRDDGTAADLLAQGGVGGLRLARRTMDGVDQATAGDGQAVLLAKQRGNLAERQAQLFVENHGEGHRLRAQLRARGAEGIGGLQRMPPLHAPTTRATRADVNPKLPDDHPRNREFFLILRHDARLAHTPATVRTGARHGRLVAFIDPSRPSAIRLHPVPRPRLAAGPPRMRGQRLRERRRLPLGRPAGQVERLPESIVLTSQSIALPLDPLKFTLQPRALGLCALGTLTPLDLARVVIVVARLWHATFMADSPKLYKYGILDRPRMADRARSEPANQVPRIL